MQQFNHLSAFFFAIVFVCLSTLGLSGCETTTSGGSVGVERKQLLLVSSQQLDQMAAQSYAKLQKMMNASQGGRPPEFLSSHPAEASRVQQIQSLLPTVLPLYVATGGRR